jgi:hypothetical protein
MITVRLILGAQQIAQTVQQVILVNRMASLFPAGLDFTRMEVNSSAQHVLKVSIHQQLLFLAWIVLLEVFARKAIACRRHAPKVCLVQMAQLSVQCATMDGFLQNSPVPARFAQLDFVAHLSNLLCLALRDPTLWRDRHDVCHVPQDTSLQCKLLHALPVCQGLIVPPIVPWIRRIKSNALLEHSPYLMPQHVKIVIPVRIPLQDRAVARSVNQGTNVFKGRNHLFACQAHMQMGAWLYVWSALQGSIPISMVPILANLVR